MQFRLASIPVRVRAPFLFIALLFASNLKRPDAVAVGAAVVFVSVLVHELGHAAIGKLFGLSPAIELHGMGGTTSWISGRDVGHGRSILISLAGPFAGFALYGAVELGLLAGFRPSHVLGALAIRLLEQVNVGWGIMNLVPLLPLDGGNVMRSALMLLTKGRGEKPARVISILMGGLFLLYGLLIGSTWIALLGGMFTYMNVQAYRQADQRALDLPLAQAIERAYVAIDRQDGAEAARFLRPVLVPGTAPELRELGVRLYAYALLLDEQWGELLPLLDEERATVGVEELEKYARTAREVGRAEDAARIEAIRASIATTPTTG